MKNEWVDRKFNFGFDYLHYPEFIERLMATPSILETLIKPIPGDFLKIKENDKWSIQENVGHLITTDELFLGRLDEYESGAKSLSPADVSGSRTNDENYNATSIEDLSRIFRENRMEYVQRLERLDSNLFTKTAWHPRLKIEMRLCDMIYFQAEHDDHHLNKIKFLSQSYF
jgi:uncharacterized damage-inducible protein DinB